MQIFLATAVLLVICFIGLGFNIFFRKKPFPETEVGRNKEMRRMGIKCVKCEELEKFKNLQRLKKVTFDKSQISKE